LSSKKLSWYHTQNRR